MNQNKKTNPVDILNYWFSIELFSPQPLPPLTGKGGTVITPKEDQDLDWLRPNPDSRTRNDKQRYRYRVFVGLFAQSNLSESVIRHFSQLDIPETERIALDNRQNAEYCLFSFDIDDSGIPIKESFFLSSAAWALGKWPSQQQEYGKILELYEKATEQSKDHFRAWADKFHKAKDNTQNEQLSNLVALPSTRKNPEINAPQASEDSEQPDCHVLLGIDHIRELSNHMAETIGWNTWLKRSQYTSLRIQRMLSRRHDDNTQPDDPLNSFFLGDLIHITKKIASNNRQALLHACLGPENPTHRLDVNEKLDTVWNILAPKCFPVGCWPAPGHYPLAHSQQLAVNQAINNLEEGGILAVNGPPGTGKTTLLQDIVAAVICQRAQALLELDDPEKLFSGSFSVEHPNRNRNSAIHPFAPTFLQRGIVVASSNNGAVENISLELPDSSAVDPSWLDKTDYFRETATVLLDTGNNQRNNQKSSDNKAWALLAARLGNSSNRNQFMQAFWFQNDGRTFREYLDEKINSNRDRSPLNDWNTAKQAFQEALNEQNQWQKDAQTIFDTLKNTAELLNHLQELETEIQRHRQQIAEAQNCLDKARAYTREAEITLLDRQQAAEAHRQNHPGRLQTFLTLGWAWWTWRKQNRSLQHALSSAERSHRKAVLIEEQERDKAVKAQRRYQDSCMRRNKCHAKLAKCKAVIEAAQDQGWQIPHWKTWETNEAARELAAPWHHPKWREARTKVFLHALALHRAAIDYQPKKFRANLSLLVDLLKNKRLKGANRQKAVRAAWDTLFFVIPVISTTFASFARQFRDFGHDEIGWLLIDEAGQAPPQAAVGALWRSRCAIVVGDPYQLEPISNLPFSVQSKLAQYHGVSEEWIPERTSAQGMADRASAIGTWRETPDGQRIWIGCPLRVHRRCDEPMFRIANEIAYANKMVNGVTRKQDLDLPPSGWCHISSHETEAQGHWIRQETDAAARLARWLIHDANIPPGEIFVISPFRDTVNAFSRDPVLKTTRSGTIHTVQGKQAKVVILVLGGNPGKPGAKAWASEKPNLLNVAVTRACRRLYIVGDRDKWRKYPYFEVCARYLDIITAEDFKFDWAEIIL